MKHKPKPKERFTAARNDRKILYHYFPTDEAHSVAVQGGRCRQCKHITAYTCQQCGHWYCKKHMQHGCKKRLDYAL